MHFVQHDAFQVGEIVSRSVPGTEQRQLLGRGQQDVRRVLALALLLRLFGVAGTAFDMDVQPDLADRRHQIALNISGQRLQRRQIKRMHAAARPETGARPALG